MYTHTHTQAELSFQHNNLLDDIDRYKIDVARADQISKEERDRRMEAMQECEKLQEHVVSLKALAAREGLVKHPVVCMYVCIYACMYVCMYVCACRSHMFMQAYIHTCIHTFLHTHVYTYIHTY